MSRGKYDISFDDGTRLVNIMKDQTEEEEAITRAYSTALRHGADISFVVEQLEKTRGDLQSFTKSMARALKNYVKDGTEVSGELCPDCLKEGNKSKIIRENGCLICRVCGYSKCGG